MNFLRKVGAEIQAQHSLISMLIEDLAGYVSARSHKTIHASSLTKEDGFCPREYALLHCSGKELKKQYVSAAMRVAFDNGHALEELCRDKWLRNRVVGHWICLNCDHRYEFQKVPVKCSKCSHRQFRYDEVIFKDPETETQGAIDFFIDFGTGKLVTCEVKSIAKDDFDKLKAPMGEHRVRTQVYLEIIKRVQGTKSVHGIDTTYGKILYISKGFGKKHEEFGKIIPFKEFRVDANTSTALTYLNKAAEVTRFRKVGVIPKGICPTPMVKRCKSCAVTEECWSGRYPAGSILREWRSARYDIEE